MAVLVVFGMSSSVCRGGVACLCWWLGGNCYHRRCFAACRRRVGGLWSQNPPSGCSEGPASRARGGVYGRKIPRVVAWKGQGRVLFRWLCWSCSARLRLFVVACLCWWLGGNCYHRRCVAACRRRVGGLWSQNPPSGCSKCSPSRWNGGDMGCLGCSGLRFGCAGSWRGVFCAAACRVRRASVRAAGMIEPPVGA